MSREIEFRGKRIDTGEWIFGSYLHQYYSIKNQGLIDAIAYTEKNQTFRPQVDSETVGQFVGLQNGKKIFEGDIVTGINRITEEEIPQKVTFLNGCFMFGNWNAHEYFNKHQFITVVGNIYDHPELMGGKG